MTIYTCPHSIEGILTCIYEAWISKKGYKNVQLLLEPVEQRSLFDEYVEVSPDMVKAQKLMDAVMAKVSPEYYATVAYVCMSNRKDIPNLLFHYLMLGFHFGPSAARMVQYEDVMTVCEIKKNLENEAHHFREFLRFHEIRKALYVAHIEPKNPVVMALGYPFMDRMPSEHWMIVDDIHREAVIHPKNEHFYVRKLSEEELNRLLLTEQENDSYTDMWKVFFDAIAIKERANAKCQTNLFPQWMRKHAVEFVEN